ncbi:hypothetical protein CDV36_013762 [Fusarium kuroshium]|uniref:Uncharacterized protein n=1 Tax=Fusarium kuroshium TaxID=2010991 RepID=A0A3M2RP63_9HYPO|nr:hypothetical protein CDV36_013762 [Fusarium kuroshium]
MIRGQLDFGVFPTPYSQRCGAHPPPLNPSEDPIGSGLLKARQRLCATCAQPSQHRVDMMKDQSTLVDSLWPGCESEQGISDMETDLVREDEVKRTADRSLKSARYHTSRYPPPLIA